MFFIFALLTGGMNLAIDSTAGERERGSLEPLLCLPVTRRPADYRQNPRGVPVYEFVAVFKPLLVFCRA